MPFYFPARQIEIIYYPGVITAAALYLQASGKNLCLYWCTELNITNWRTRNLWQPSTFPVFVTLIVIVTLTQVDKSCHLFSKARHFHHWWLRLMYSYRCEMWDVRCEMWEILNYVVLCLPSQLDWLQLYSSACSMSSSSSSTSGN